MRAPLPASPLLSASASGPARQGARCPRARRPGRRREHDDQRHERRHDPVAFRRGRCGGLRVGVAALVDRRRDGRPHRRPAHLGPGDHAAPRAPEAALAARSGQPARAARGREHARVARRLLARSARDLPVARVGHAPLPSAGRGRRLLRRGGDRRRRRRGGHEPHRGCEHDGGRADPRGPPRIRDDQHADPGGRAHRARVRREPPRASAGAPRRGAGGRAHRQLGVGRPPPPPPASEPIASSGPTSSTGSTGSSRSPSTSRTRASSRACIQTTASGLPLP